MTRCYGLHQFWRLGADLSPPSATSQWTLTGFGATASVSLDRCNDQRGRVTITAAGGSYTANATAAFAYAQPWTSAPHVYVCRGGGSQATIIMSTTVESTTGFTTMFNGTATGAETYTFNYVALQ